MGLLFEILSGTMIWVTKPWIVLKLGCLFGIKTCLILMVSWTEVVKATIHFHLTLLYKMFVLIVAFLTLPFRLLIAISRERQLEKQVGDMKRELESLFWDRKALQRRLRLAIREVKTMDLILEDIESEHHKALTKIQLLQNQLHELRTENLRLTENRGKDYWQLASTNDNYNENRNLIMHPNERWNGSNTTSDQSLMLKHVASEKRKTAIGESLFTALLSLLIGIVIWEAEETCTPLVTALFAMVSISLKSVLEYFSVVRTKQASEAAMLLSLNCFILGALTYPTLPGVARITAPTVSTITKRAARFIGLSASS